MDYLRDSWFRSISTKFKIFKNLFILFITVALIYYTKQ